MFNEIIEINTEDCIKESKHKHPTLKEVQKKMQGFPESLIFYTYHKLNGRDQEAESYLNEWHDEQEELYNSFNKKNDLNQIETNKKQIEANKEIDV